MRVIGALYALTFIGGLKFLSGFSKAPETKEVADEEHFRLITNF